MSPIPQGAACERCAKRRKKARVRPQCGACAAAGVQCTVDLGRADRSIVSEYNRALTQVSELQNRVQWLEDFIKTSTAVTEIHGTPTGTRLCQSTNISQLASPQNVPPSQWFLPLLLRDAPDQPQTPTPLPTLVDMLPLEQAMEHVRIYLGRYVLPHHNTDRKQLEEDVSLVYADGDQQSPELCASRFRSYMVIYINILMKKHPPNPNTDRLATICRSVVMRELKVLLSSEDITAAQALSFVGIMALHEPGGPSFYQVVGFAARIAMSIKLHRHSTVYLQSTSPTSPDQEAGDLFEQRRRRIFWAIYALDRLAVFNLNLPPSLRDSDIDIELPEPSSSENGALSIPETAILCHSIKQRTLYGRIHESLYGATAKPIGELAAREAVVSNLMQEVQMWYDGNPLRSAFVLTSEETVARQILDDLTYHHMVLALHRPSPLIPNVSSQFVTTLKASAIMAIHLYSHNWARYNPSYSWIHLCSVFTACTTLIYCYCECLSRPDLMDVSLDEVNSMIETCRDLIGRFSPLWPQAAPYQKMFDTLVAAFKSMSAPSLPTPTSPYMPTGSAEGDLSGLFSADLDDLGSYADSVMRGFWTDAGV